MLFFLGVLAGCGRQTVEIVTPGEGQVFPLDGANPFTEILVQLANNEYQGTTIEFKGTDILKDQVRCTNSANSAARCDNLLRLQQGGYYGNNSMNCTAQTGLCSITIVVTRDGRIEAVREIKFRRGQ